MRRDASVNLALARGNVPTFAGFECALGAHPNRVINTDFLTLEVMVVPVNSDLLWLLFKNRGGEELSPEQIRALAEKMRKSQVR